MIGGYYRPGIEVWRATSTPTAIGGYTRAWAKAATIEGLIRPLAGGREKSAGKIVDTSTHKLYCAPAEIKSQDKIVYGGEQYRINHIKDPMLFGRHLEIELELTDHDQAIPMEEAE